MERRYGREKARYRARINKEPKRKEPEKVLAIQSIVCIMLLLAGVLFSYLDISGAKSGYITEILYKTNSIKDWKNTVYPVLKTAKKGGEKTVSAIIKGVELCEEKLGIDKASKSSAPVNAKAKEEKPKKEEVKEEPKESEVKAEPKKEELTLRSPTEGEISSVFGSREQPLSGASVAHAGIDIAAPLGQTVISAAPGVVTMAGYDNANGHYVVIKHNEELTTVYAHLLKTCVKKDEIVDDNTKIGEVGSSGISTGPHLHFEVKVNQESVDPENYITLTHRNGA